MDWILDSVKYYLFNSEYRRASFALTISEIIRVLLTTITEEYIKSYPQIIFIISVFVIWLNYTLDIFVAKDSFNNKSSIKLYGVDPKVTWYINSFIKYNFVKYLVVILITYITSSVIVKYLKEILDDRDVLTKFKYRDLLIQSIVNFFSFGLYTYFLKFRWAYVTEANPIMTMIVLCWCSM